MDAERFAKGFERPPRDYASLSGREWKRARDALVDPSIRWSHFFSHLVDDYFTGGKLDTESAEQDIGLYTGNSTRHLLTNIVEATESATVYRPTLAHNLNSMNFHTMNQEMGASWLHLINPKEHPPLDYIHLTAIQARLAVRALGLVERRRKLYDEALAASSRQFPKNALLDQSFVGRITEIDAAITLLQVVKQRPFDEVDRLMVLPAPSKYEAASNKRSDFLLINTQELQAHGVQVKTRVHDYDASEYDEAFVSFVDGVEDLGNYKIKERANGFGSRQPVPGLIAADFILHGEGLSRHSAFSRLAEFKGTYGAIYHAKEVAETMQVHMSYTDRVSRAAEKIGDRLIAALKDNGPEDETEPDESPSSE